MSAPATRLRLSMVLLAGLLTASSLAAVPASAQPSSAEAESHFKRGVSLYQESDFRGALAEFKRAYELTHNWRLLFNVAQAEFQAHDYAAAIGDFETYLREGGDKLPRGRRTEVEQELTKLRARVGRLVVRANVDGAAVTIDDEPAGVAPLTREVAVGARRIVVKKDGYAVWSRAVEVASGDGVTVDVALEALGTTAPPPPPPPPPPESHFLWEPWAVTGAITVAAVTTGILALGAASRLDDAKNRFDVTDSELHDDSKRIKTLSLVTDILVVGALASGGIALYLSLKAPSAESRASLQLAPRLGGLAAVGRF